MELNMKLVTEVEVMESALNVKGSILQKVVKMEEYILNQFDLDVKELLEIFYNIRPFDKETVKEKSEKILSVLDLFNQKETLIHRVIKSLELGYVHHIKHITTSEMAAELGISKQAIHAHIFDLNDPKEVEKVKKNTKKRFIPVKKYPKLILAEKQDFDLFKEWFLNKKTKWE